MATYKVLQDIEAEDKLLGPLTLRQFIYALSAAFFGWLTFIVASKGSPAVAAIFIPFVLIPGFFAWPWSREQPTEIWALAKIRFLIKPRKRVWDQSEIKELVTITVPKKVEQVLTNGLSQNEVKSRLKALANTLDSRGWAVKNVDISTYGQVVSYATPQTSDRLVNLNSFPQQVPTIDTRNTNDVLDPQTSRVLHNFDGMISASAKAHRQTVLDRLQSGTASSQTPQTNDYWFMSQPSPTDIPAGTVTFNSQVVSPGAAPSDLPITSATPDPNEASYIQQLPKEQFVGLNTQGHVRVLQPPSTTTMLPPQPITPTTTITAPTLSQPALPQAQPKVTRQANTAILELARNNDLNVATLAREAQKRGGSPQEEVVIFHR